jgi:cellulose synthase/poly-beta-1,6-N-acetylglucosamine synthase-like glycosyltransferase
VTFSMWELAAAVVVPPLVLNLVRWWLDLELIRNLEAVREMTVRADWPATGSERVSFLVAAWNEETRLRGCILAVLGLSYPDLEIVLCAGGTDRTWQVASEFTDPRVVLLAQAPGEGKQKSLQRCLDAATGNIVYLLDADCLLHESTFGRILSPILSGHEDAVTSSPCEPVSGQLRSPFVLSQCACRVYTSLHQPVYCSGLDGANTAMRREALEQAGGFDAEVRTGVDYDLGKRLLQQGRRVRYEAAAAIPVEFHAQIGSYVRQQTRWLRNVVIHGLRFGAYSEAASCFCTSLVGFVMLFLPCATLAGALAAGLSSAGVRLSAAVWGVAFLHAFLSRLRYCRFASLWLGIRFPRRVAALLPMFLMVDFVAWSLPLVQYPSRALRERW